MPLANLVRRPRRCILSSSFLAVGAGGQRERPDGARREYRNGVGKSYRSFERGALQDHECKLTATAPVGRFTSLRWHGDGLDPLGSEVQGGGIETAFLPPPQPTWQRRSSRAGCGLATALVSRSAPAPEPAAGKAIVEQQHAEEQHDVVQESIVSGENDRRLERGDDQEAGDAEMPRQQRASQTRSRARTASAKTRSPWRHTPAGPLRGIRPPGGCPWVRSIRRSGKERMENGEGDAPEGAEPDPARPQHQRRPKQLSAILRPASAGMGQSVQRQPADDSGRSKTFALPDGKVLIGRARRGGSHE